MYIMIQEKSIESVLKLNQYVKYIIKLIIIKEILNLPIRKTHKNQFAFF